MDTIILSILDSLGKYVTMVLRVVALIFRHPPRWNLIQHQLYNIGVLSLPVVAITGFSTGLVLASQSFFQLDDKGLAGATGLMVAKSMMVELGPILTAFMVTGRVGASMCAEIGTMKVTEQIDALRSMSIDPLQHLIAPRFLAGAVMIPLLSIFSCLLGGIGGYLISIFHFGMTPAAFLEPIKLYVEDFDLLSGIIKAFVFGILLITISCYKGLQTKGGAAGVGKYTTDSVVICYSMILIINFALTLALNGFYDTFLRL